MRLLVDGSIYAGKPGGIQVYMERLATALAEQCDVTVLTSVPEEMQAVGCRLVRIPRWTKTPRGRTLWELTALAKYCTRRYDALLCVTPIAPWTRIPVISVVHDLTPLILHREYHTRTKTLLWAGLQTLRRASAVMTDSAHTRRDFLRTGIARPQDVHVVYPGIQNAPVPQPTGAFDNLRPFVLYVGSHKPNKNLGRLLRAFGRIRGHDCLRLVLAGVDEDRYARATEAVVRSVGLERRVTTLRKGLSLTDMSSLYAAADAFVHPSLYEGFGIPLAEAMAHGIPCAASRMSSLPEVGGDASLYFDPQSVDDMTKVLQTLLDNEPMREQLRAAGPRQASRFTWKRTALAVLAAIELATGSRLKRC